MPEIEIRPVLAPEIPLLAKFDHSVETSYVWQMERAQLVGQLTISFREIRMPRQVRVPYPRPAAALTENWNSHSGILTAVLRGDPVGYICINQPQNTGTAWVSDMAVSPAVRRQGIGSGLLLAAQAWGVEHGLKRLVFEMPSKNYPAVCLALKLGLEFCGYNDQYYSNHDIALFFAGFIK
jgi:GNAT superfamily N-acetyltransferase